MHDTEITVVGRVATPPRRARVDSGGHVTNFRIAATRRRYDAGREEWADAETFWSDVECWGELGAHVVRSISKGDPVVVVGRLWTRDYESQHGRGSTSQIRARAVGPNLNHGWAEFVRPPRGGRPEEASTDVVPGTVRAELADSADEPDQTAFEGRLTSEDYVTAPDTFSSMDPECTVATPAPL